MATPSSMSNSTCGLVLKMGNNRIRNIMRGVAIPSSMPKIHCDIPANWTVLQESPTTAYRKTSQPQDSQKMKAKCPKLKPNKALISATSQNKNEKPRTYPETFCLGYEMSMSRNDLWGQSHPP